jgi:NitT/TauT family transport system substrate-binding protein
VDAGDPIVVLAGVHAGCFELFGSERVRAIRDLRGRSIAVDELGGSPHIFLASILAHVGLNPEKDVTWVTLPLAESTRLLAEGRIDGFLGFPPVTQRLRTDKIGRVLLNSAVDRPWSQYFCCMVVAHREFVRRNPVATKRALRAILKAADLCALEPERVARSITDKGYVARFEDALQTMRDIPYTAWRSYDPTDTFRFYALRLQEAGMIKSSPPRILAQGTDWRFFNELKKELKG